MPSAQLVLFDDRERRELAWEVHRLIRRLRLQPPIDAVAVASARGIGSIHEVRQEMAGYLFRDGRSFTVHLRRGDPRERQRFTILHEAGHTLLKDFSQDVEFRCADLAVTRKEQLANLVAAEFLFPWDYFEGDLGFHGLSLSGIEFLARRYQASLEASAVHAVERFSRPALLGVIRGDMPGDPPGTLRTLYTRGTNSWPLHWQGRSLTDVPSVRQALSQKRGTGVVPWVDDRGVETLLRVEAGCYPLTLGGQRRQRVLALYQEVVDDGV